MSSDEYKLHLAVLKHIQSAFPDCMCFHVPNQSRDATEAYFNKQMGVRPGVSDLIIVWPNNTGALELKTPQGRLSTAQNKFLSAVSHYGWHTGQARSVKAAHRVLSSWGLRAKHTAIVEPNYHTKEEKFDLMRDWYKP